MNSNRKGRIKKIRNIFGIIILCTVIIMIGPGYLLKIQNNTSGSYGQEKWTGILTNQLISSIFPMNYYDNEKDEGTQLITRALELVRDSLFPSVSFVNKSDTQELAVANELYPTVEDLEEMARENSQEETTMESEASADETQEVVEALSGSGNGIIYPMESLMDHSFLIENFYTGPALSEADSSLLNGEVLVNKDLTMDLTGDEPKILIYHTHSQEAFTDSVPGDESGTIVGMGDTLASILQDKYGVSVYHDRNTYDIVDGVLDRSTAYSVALGSVEEILANNPSIKVVIDLHRDGVNEATHLITEINGKQVAKIMFFNGLSQSPSGYLQNDYLSDNLAFSLQMQLKAAELFPGFTRKIYLRSYRYNMHVMPRTLLVECGGQTNTVEEVRNAMEPLADTLYSVLSGQ